MKKILLGGVAVAALAIGYAGSAWADSEIRNRQSGCESGACVNTQLDESVSAEVIADDQSTASENGGIANVGLDNTGTAIAGGNDPIAEDGASVVTGDLNTTTSVSSADAVASNGSTAISTGAFVVGDGAALGKYADGNAVAVNGSTAVVVDYGYAVAVVGSTAMANTSLFAVGGDDSINLATLTALADSGSAFVVGDDNVVVANDSGGVAENGSAAVVGENNLTIATNGAVADGEGAAVGLGNGNAVSAAFLEQELADGGEGYAIKFDLVGESPNCSDDCTAQGGNWTSGNIGGDGELAGNITGAATGINSALFNTGLVNQGRPVAVSAIASF